MLRKMLSTDLTDCAEILCQVYNNELWQCRWELHTAKAYLMDYFEGKKFVGFVLEEEGKLRGALFAREKIWWNNSEIFLDEMFVRPDCQGRGLGTALLNQLQAHIAEKGLAGCTLTTNRYAPAPVFYKKNGFSEYEHVLFMGKEWPC